MSGNASLLQLQNRFSEVTGAVQSMLEAEAWPYARNTDDTLQKMLTDCQSLLSCLENKRKGMVLSVACETMDGTVFHVEALPAVDTVMDFKRRIRKANHSEKFGVELSAKHDAVAMRNDDRLDDYIFESGIIVTFVANPPEFCLYWDAAAEQWVDAVGNYDIFVVEDPRATGDGAMLCRPLTLDQLLLCRKGAGPFVSASAMPTGIEVAKTGWTCSFFTQAPRTHDNGSYYCRTVLGARPDVAHILMNSLRIGTYGDNGHQEVDFDMSSLDEGWHHVCVVADAAVREQVFWINKRVVGRLPAILEPIFKIGNSSDGAQSWACPIKDLQLFQRVLDEEEIASFVMPHAMAQGDRISQNPKVS